MTGAVRVVRVARVARRAVKRLMDIVLSCLALVLLSPLLAFIAVVVRVRLGSPVLFRQLRPGRHGVPFELTKFRTMTSARGPDGVLLPDDRRLPAFGRFLRRTSLDELPELVQVLRGHMSLVGPRPLLMEYLPLYTPLQARRHEVRPGLSGWAQINGRNAVVWDDKFTYDVWYVDHWTLTLDARIIWRTLALAVRGSGVGGDGTHTMQVFTGTGMR